MFIYNKGKYEEYKDYCMFILWNVIGEILRAQNKYNGTEKGWLFMERYRIKRKGMAPT